MSYIFAQKRLKAYFPLSDEANTSGSSPEYVSTSLCSALNAFQRPPGSVKTGSPAVFDSEIPTSDYRR